LNWTGTGSGSLSSTRRLPGLSTGLNKIVPATSAS
jgi:hypothetical protein